MKLTHLAALRQASPGSPSMREAARRMKVSPELLSRFESGRQVLSEAKLALYAKCLGTSVDVVERMFQLTALRYHRTCAAEILDRIKGKRGKVRPSRELQSA